MGSIAPRNPSSVSTASVRLEGAGNASMIRTSPSKSSKLPGKNATIAKIRNAVNSPSLRAIRRTTPALLGLFSLVTLLAHGWMAQAAGAFRRAAWYHKSHPTFADALALVRKELWAQEETFYGSPADTEPVKVPKAFMERLTDALCYAA